MKPMTLLTLVISLVAFESHSASSIPVNDDFEGTELVWGSACDPTEEGSCGDAATKLICSPEGICVCPFNHNTNKNGHCRKLYAHSCATITECNIDRYLTCDYDRMSCACQQPDKQVWSKERQHCVSMQSFKCDMPYAGAENMDFVLSCVENASCDMSLENGSMRHVCECNKPYWKTEDNRCALRGKTNFTSTV